MGCASDSTSNGGRSVTAATVAGHESVIQKYLQQEGAQRGKVEAQLQCGSGGGQ